jgi:membrane associated rhomboid family serine protease
MGIHDRDYYREDTRGWWGSAMEHRGTVALIAVTVSCMIALYAFVDHRPVEVGGVRVQATVYPLQEACDFHHPSVMQGQVWRFVTSFFVSWFSLFSLVFGMLGLYWFGGEMETLYGTRRFVTFYVLAGVLANVGKFALGLGGVGVATRTMGPAAPLFATFVLFAFHYPHRPIRVWFLLPIPVWVLVAVYLGFSLLGAAGEAGGRGGDGLPVFADPLVGAAVGFLYHRSGGRLFGLFDGLAGLLSREPRARRRSPANLRVYDETAPQPATVSASRSDVEPPTVPAGEPKTAFAAVDEHLEAKLDAVLEKLKRHGRESLTAEENAVLLRASEVFKRRRT